MAIKGYMYGPVRDLVGTGTGTGVDLTWNKPYAAVGSTSVEDRTVEYRVFRATQAAPTVWTDLTSSAVVADTGTSISYSDDTAAQGTTYLYKVVAYTSGNQAEYGLESETTGRFATDNIDIQASVDKPQIVSGGTVMFNYRVQNTGGTTLNGFTITDNWGTVSDPDIPASLALARRSTRSAPGR